METTTRQPVFTLGDRLAKARRVAGIGSAEMADRLGVSRTTITNYESERTEPTVHVVREWAYLTGVDIAWLLAEESPDLRSRCFLNEAGEAHQPGLPFTSYDGYDHVPASWAAA